MFLSISSRIFSLDPLQMIKLSHASFVDRIQIFPHFSSQHKTKTAATSRSCSPAPGLWSVAIFIVRFKSNGIFLQFSVCLLLCLILFPVTDNIYIALWLMFIVFFDCRFFLSFTEKKQFSGNFFCLLGLPFPYPYVSLIINIRGSYDVV